MHRVLRPFLFFFSFFFLSFLRDHIPVPLLYTGAGSRSPGRKRVKSHPFPSETWSLKDPHFLHGGVRFHFFLDFHPAFPEAQHLSGLVYTFCYVARVVSQHTLLYDAESLCQPFHFYILLLQKLEDVLPSLSSWRSIQVHFPHGFVFEFKNPFTSSSCVEEWVGIVGNGCTLGPKSYPSSLRPKLRLAGPGIHGQTGHHSATKHFQWDAIRKRSFGLFLVTDCGGFAVSTRRFHTSICP